MVQLVGEGRGKGGRSENILVALAEGWRRKAEVPRRDRHHGLPPKPNPTPIQKTATNVDLEVTNAITHPA